MTPIRHIPRLIAATAALVFCAATAQAEIIVATAGPMKGPFAAYGAQLKQGAELAVADLNAKGGVLGQKIKLIVADDACDPKAAVKAAKSLVNQGVNFMAGHFCSAASITASDIYHKEGIVMISPSASHPFLTERGLENVYRVSGRDDQQGIVAGNLLADQFDGKKVAIVHDGQAYSMSLADTAKAQLNARGINEALYQTIKPGEKSYAALVTTMKEKQIDVLYYGGYHREAGLIRREMEKQGLSAVLMSGDDLATGKYWIVSGKAGAGTLMTFPPDPSKSKHGRRLADEMRKKGMKPGLHAFRAYAAMQIWAEAAAKAGSLEMAKVTKALRSNIFRTVLGKITFNGKGDIKQTAFVWYEWRRGKYEVKVFKEKKTE